MKVTIDGPAGSGKSTVARKLANRLGFIHLNSGALFRAVGLKALRCGISLEDDEAVSNLAQNTSFVFELVMPEHQGKEPWTRLLVDACDLSEKLKQEQVGELASRIGVLPKLREVLVEVQRDVAEGQSVVLEGRDAGTVVFPDADVKFYLDAAPEIRAQRRFKELTAASSDNAVSLEQVQRDISVRDQREMTRKVAPLKPAEDAVYIDSSSLTIAQVVDKLARGVKTRTNY